MKLIDDYKRCLRLLSIQVHLAAGGYLLVYALMPVLDPTIARLLPTPYQTAAIGIYAVLGIAARLIAQPKVAPKPDSTQGTGQ